MRAVEHDHRGAGRLVLGLADEQVAVVDVEGDLQPLARERGEERPADVEVHGVAELVGLGRPRGLDAGGEVAGVVAAEGRPAEGPQQVAQGLVPEEVRALLGELELHRRPRGPHPAAAGRGVVEGAVLGHLQVALADHPLDDLVQELLEGVAVVEQPLDVLVGQEAAAHEGVEDGVVQRLQLVLVELAVLGPEAALQEEVGHLPHQLAEVEVVPQLADVAVVARDRHQFTCFLSLRRRSRRSMSASLSTRRSGAVNPRSSERPIFFWA